MEPAPHRDNPIVVKAGDSQQGVDPQGLRPSRRDLIRVRLEAQGALIRSNRVRATPILVTIDGVIFDGHHAVRASAEEGTLVDVSVTPMPIAASAGSIMDLPVR